MTSAAEAETAGVFGNGQKIIAIRILLKALGHPQLATLLKTDNSMSNSFLHANIKCTMLIVLNNHYDERKVLIEMM